MVERTEEVKCRRDEKPRSEFHERWGGGEDGPLFYTASSACAVAQEQYSQLGRQCPCACTLRISTLPLPFLITDS